MAVEQHFARFSGEAQIERRANEAAERDAFPCGAELSGAPDDLYARRGSRDVYRRDTYSTLVNLGLRSKLGLVALP